VNSGSASRNQTSNGTADHRQISSVNLDHRESVPAIWPNALINEGMTNRHLASMALVLLEGRLFCLDTVHFPAITFSRAQYYRGVLHSSLAPLLLEIAMH
jgi:hypothetical protein